MPLSARASAVRKVIFVDVSKAHLYASINVDIDAYVELPLECRKDNTCGRLNYWLYGMRPASKGWETEYTKRLQALGFIPRKASPCCFYRQADDVSVVVHGDDFVFEGPSDVFKEIANALRKYWIIKLRATIGPDAKDDKEVSILNRIVRWTTEGMEYEADPRHVEKLLRDMDMVGVSLFIFTRRQSQCRGRRQREYAVGGRLHHIVSLGCCSVQLLECRQAGHPLRDQGAL